MNTIQIAKVVYDVSEALAAIGEPEKVVLWNDAAPKVRTSIVDSVKELRDNKGSTPESLYNRRVKAAEREGRTVKAYSELDDERRLKDIILYSITTSLMHA